MHEADVRVVLLGRGRGEEEQHGLGRRLLGAAHQLFADAVALVRNADRKVGEMGGVGPVTVPEL
jgi:hypothetical protein